MGCVLCGWCFSYLCYMGVLGPNWKVRTEFELSFSLLWKSIVTFFASKGVALLILCISHCSLRVNVISPESCKLLMWKSADLGDEKPWLGLVSEIACQVRSFPCFQSVSSAFLSVLHQQQQFSEAACLPVLFHLFPSGIDPASGQRKFLPWHFLTKLLFFSFFPPPHQYNSPW